MKNPITAEEWKEFKRRYDNLKRLARRYMDASKEFDLYAQDFYDFSHSDTDDDELIDTLDYGINSISFKEYVRRMNAYEEDFVNGTPFRVVP